jgi:hypothetical protein
MKMKEFDRYAVQVEVALTKPTPLVDYSPGRHTHFGASGVGVDDSSTNRLGSAVVSTLFMK